MGCKCCRWPVNACRMARLARLLPLSATALVLFLAVHCFWNDAVVLGTLLLVLFFPVFDFFPTGKGLKLPPGPGGVPVLGYVPFLGEKPHLEMANLAKKYGPLVHIQLGSFPGFVVANAQLAKEVLMTHGQVFASRPDSFVTWAKYFAYYDVSDPEARRSMGTANPGSFLRTMRRLVAVELMAPKHLDLLRAICAEEVDAMVQGVLAQMESEGKGVVDLNAAVGAMGMNVMTRMVIRKRYYGKEVSPESRKEASEFQRLLVSVLTWAGHPFVQDFIPALRPLMSLISSHEREMARIAKRTDAFLESILQEHRQRNNTVESSQDFVDVLIQFVGDDGKLLDDKTIKAVTMEMFMAGVETTSTSTEWTLAELLHHPHVQTKLQAELDAVVGPRRTVQESDLASLPYLRAVLRESFRLHPASPLMIPHSNSQPVELQGYHVPAGSHVFVNVWAIGRDPAVWARPEVFDPDRFLRSTKQVDERKGDEKSTRMDEVGLTSKSTSWVDEQTGEVTPSVDEIDFKGGHFELWPFGSGRPGCPGMVAGAAVVGLAVARLVHGFRWSLVDGRAAVDMDMEERFGMNLQMRSPLYRVCCEARLPAQAYGCGS